MEKLKNWMTETASVLFDSDANDFRALPKVVRMRHGFDELFMEFVF